MTIRAPRYQEVVSQKVKSEHGRSGRRFLTRCAGFEEEIAIVTCGLESKYAKEKGRQADLSFSDRQEEIN